MKKKENGQKMPKRKRWLLRIMIFCVILIFCWLQNNLLTVTFYNFSCEKWNNEEAGFRIVQLSDLHNASFGYGNRHLIDKVKALEPDMIVLTGDLVDANHTKLEVAGSLVKELTGICPVYFVDGNHEVWLDEAEKQKLYESLENAGVNVLLNACEQIAAKGTTLYVLGLEDASLGNASILHDLLSGLAPDHFTLLLAHEPQYLKNYSRNQIDLVLTGHAHGGQIRLPWIGGVVAPDQGLFPEYTEGVHVAGDTTMIISRGLGNSILPVRLFNLPEIVCVDLTD